HAIESVQPEAVLRQPGRERGRMRTVLVPILDGLVRQEPRVAAATAATARGAPSGHVGGVLVRHAERETVEGRVAGRREMEHEFVAVVHEPWAVDWVVGAHGRVSGVSEAGAWW